MIALLVCKLQRIVVCAVVLTAGGCSGAYDAYVAGKVTLDGESVSKGGIAFVPESGGPSAYAQIDESGSYEVFTGKERGLPSGSYGITVVSREPPSADRSKDGGPPPPGKAITPPWYATLDTSPLKQSVEPGSNEVNLELSSEPPPDWVAPQRRRRR